MASIARSRGCGAPVRDVFWLYRPTAPSNRAQSIQVVNAAHALAARGHRVVLAVRPPPGPRPSPADVLAWYGLAPLPTLALAVLPAGGTAAAIAHRALYLGWLVRTRGRGVAIARSKRYAVEAARLGGRIVLEVHEVDSLQAEERGEDPRPVRALEARALAAAVGVVANAPGTLALLERAHPVLPPAVALHNATHAARARAMAPDAHGVGYVGSYRREKDLETLARAAARLDLPVHLVGAEGAEALQPLARGRLVLEPALPHARVPDRLARFRVLVLPLGRGLFGAHLTSPLKLWDYLAVDVPLVAADTPAIREAAPGCYRPYAPGDADGLARALAEVHGDRNAREALRHRPPPRTWADRARELERFLDEVAP